MIQEEEKKQKRQNLQKFRALLEAAPFVHVNAQWRDVKEKISSDPTFKKLDPFESLKVFEDLIRELESKEIEEDRIRMEEHKRFSRKARAQFRVCTSARPLERRVNKGV